MKKTLYPKTTRVGDVKVQVTEKLDGSNLGFFNLEGDLLIAQRSNLYLLSEIEEVKGSLYRGLYQWLKDNGDNLLASLHEGSGVFGEWIGIGQLKYSESLDKKYYIFAKANIVGSMDDNTIEATNLLWRRDLLQYPFVDQEIPEYIGLPNLVATLAASASVEVLDEIYDDYLEEVDRPVEGFVILEQNGAITKYVRNKGGKLGPHMLPRK